MDVLSRMGDVRGDRPQIDDTAGARPGLLTNEPPLRHDVQPNREVMAFQQLGSCGVNLGGILIFE